MRILKAAIAVTLLVAASFCGAQTSVSSPPSTGTFAGPRPWIDPTSAPYGADPTGASDSATAVQAALNACSGAAYPVVFPAGTYILDSIVTVSNSCTVEAHPGTVIIKKNFNANASNNYTNPGYFLIAASNVTLRGLTFDCNYANFSGACVAAQGAISNITFDNGEIENCDGPCWLQLATSLGGQGPSQVLVTHSALISGVNSTTTGAGGTISAKDSGDGLQYVDNPLIDGHLDTYAGSGTFELECGHPGAQLSNLQISGNPKIISTGNPLTGGGWAIQAGSFGCNAMYGLKIENNGLEVAGSVNGIVSIPSTYGAVVKGNHFNTHFRDLYNSASDGVSQISPALFTSASASFINTIPGSATGRTLAYLCSGTWYYTLVSYASATTLTPATTPVCAGSSEQWELWGYSPTFTALELGNSIGPVVSGNTFDVESAQYLAAIWGDNTSDADISDNEILGFGQGNIGSASAGLVGIGMNAGYAENGISTITQVGHVITVTTESALIGQTQSAMKIGLCSPSNVCSGTSPYNFGYYQIDAVPTQLGTVFTVYSPTTGNACSGGHATCGYVEYVGLNNKVHGNKIEFAKILPLAGGAYGAQIKGSSSTSVVSGDSVFNNTVTGTGAGTNEYCGSVQGTAGGVVDSNTIAQNKCVNTEYGFNRTFGTNTTFDKNAFLNVTTLRTGSAQSGEIWNWTPVGPLAFSFFPACSATYEGALGFVTDSTTATNAATITGSGSNAVSAVCNGTNWVVTSGTGSGGGLSGLTTYTHLYASSATAAASVAPTTGYDGVPQVETNSTTAGAFTAAPVSAPQGVPVDIESGSTFTVALTDRYKVLNTTNGTTSTAVTVPAPSTTGFGLNFVFAHLNSGSVVATDTPTTATVNGNSTMKLVGAVAGHNPEAAFWWEDSSTSCSSGPCYWGAEILPTDANGQLAAEGLNVANACPTCVVASSPGVGIAHFAGSTQTVTSSTIATGDIAANAVTLAKLATQGANTVLANVTGSTAVPTAAAIPAGVQFYTAGTGYSAATAAQLGTVLNIAQYDIVYSNGTAAAPLGAAINGIQFDSTSAAPVAATSANILAICTTCVTSAASLTSNALMTGAGSQASQTVTTGTGVVTALGNAANATGGVALALVTVVDSSTPVTVSTTNYSEWHHNENATAATAITYDLPTAAASKQFCFDNAYNGSAANTGTLELLTSAAGQFIIFTDGTLSATGGYVISAGAARDSACLVGVDSTHWMLFPTSGTWTKH